MRKLPQLVYHPEAEKELDQATAWKKAENLITIHLCIIQVRTRKESIEMMFVINWQKL